MKDKKLAFSFALGISLSALPIVHANANPFRMETLRSGYLLADATETQALSKKVDETKCSETDQKDAKTAEEKCKPNTRSSEPNTKVKSGWCGDGGRCGYKRRE